MIIPQISRRPSKPLFNTIGISHMKLNEDVARVVWDWRGSNSTEESIRRKRKKSSLIKFCIMFLIGLILFFLLHHVWIGGIIYVLSFLILIGGFAVPQIYSAFDRVERFLTITIGSLFTWILLISFFLHHFLYGIGLLFGLFFGNKPES